MARPTALQDFVNLSETALLAAGLSGDAALAADRVIARWQSEGDAADVPAERLPVCDHLAAALAVAEDTPRQALARAFAALAPHLVWRRRGSADPSDPQFWHGHANAEILGPNGIERREDVWLGATLMAPGTDYPRHSHKPEEIYLALAPGEWWNARMDWTDPGLGRAIYNPPGILHAMRSGPAPFLALWFLPL